MYRVSHPPETLRANSPTPPPSRSRGPSPEAAPGARLFDPVQIGWLNAGTLDDLDPDAADPFAQGADPLAARGLELRHWHQHDIGQYRALLDDPEVWAQLPEPYPDPLSADIARDLITASNMLDHHDVRAVVFAGQPIGQVRLAFAPGDTARLEGELSYWLGRAHWGQGFGTAIVAGAVKRIHVNAPGLLRLIAKVRPGNRASRRVLEKAGLGLIAAPVGKGFADWRWFGLRRQSMARMRAHAR